ncbi:hypothetical protein ACFV7R_32855 [Streptomyces sp. NPDC059866]|uniref:hypothetical protein n=1 Tax=Streptomyces sp. NPDC059866 TaxID=3346978 RepID=UPI00364932ED
MDEFDEAEEHMAKAASLGDRQVRELLPQIGIDYCRKCTRPAQFRSGGTDADIVFVDIKAGMECAKCRTVLCGTCASGGRLGPVSLACPDCSGQLRVLTR